MSSGKVADGSLRLADIAVAKGTAQVDPPALPRLGTTSCATLYIDAPAVLPGDQVLLNAAAGESPDPRIDVDATVVDTAGKITVRACNVSSTNNLDAGPASYAFSAYRP